MELRKRGKKWYLDVRVRGVRHRVCLDCTDKAIAERLATEKRAELEARAAGVKTYADTKKAPLKSLVADYLAELARQEKDARYIASTCTKLERMLEGFARIQDVTTDGITKRLAAVTDRYDLSAKTQNYHRTALSGLFTWLMRVGRWGDNPVRAVARVKVVGSARERRALTAEEVEALVAAAPARRKAVYRVAVGTGLRRAELRALRWLDVDLDAGEIKLPARHAKNRKNATLPLNPLAVESLRAIKGDATPETRVFLLKNRLSSVPRMETFNEDLARAGIDAGDPATGVVDFHSLRVTFGTLLARADVSLQQAQKLMRHSTPALTSNVYTKLQLDDARAAVAKVDQLLVTAGVTIERRKALQTRTNSRSKRRAEERSGEGDKSLLREAGLEPAPGCPDKILSLARMEPEYREAPRVGKAGRIVGTAGGTTDPGAVAAALLALAPEARDPVALARAAQELRAIAAGASGCTGSPAIVDLDVLRRAVLEWAPAVADPVALARGAELVEEVAADRRAASGDVIRLERAGG